MITGFLGLIILASLTAFQKAPFASDYWLEYITSQFKKYMVIYHQNKVYIQTDKNVYESGETIYLKAYIRDDTKKKPENLVKNLYVEIIAPDKGVFMHRLLKIENGFAYGDFPVHDTVYTGLYLMRAYTQNMKNSGNNYLFSKEIRINHPQKVYYNKYFHKKAKKIVRQDEDIDLQFFPEGGEFVQGLKTVVAFKAINQNGKGIDVEGKIFSGKNNYICDFKSDYQGMGKIELTPGYNQKYYAQVTTKNGTKKKTELPKVMQTGYGLNVASTENMFTVNISTNKKFSADPVAKTVYLFIQSGGKIYSSGRHLFESDKIKLNIGKKNFPTGVLHFTLFDGQGKPQCERLAFADHKDSIGISNSLKRNKFNKKELIEFDLQVMGDEGEPTLADLAVSVAQKSTEEISKPDIRSYFLLQSDLHGKIENPAYYFSNHKKAGEHLDLLLLTQGWRKFLWKDILNDSIMKPLFPVENDLRITGRITKYLFDISVRNAKITLTLLNQFNDVFETQSGEKGYFEFTGLDYKDTLDVLIEVRTLYNRKNVLIHIDENTDMDNQFYPFKSFYLDSLKKRHKTEYKKAKPEEEDPSVPKDYKIHNYADQVIKFDDQMRSGNQNVLDALKSRVPGLTVGGGSSMIRGPSSLLLSNEPLYLIDGIPVDYQGIQSVNIQDVDYVEILKGPSSAIYGLRGANGVIAVYTKKGFYYKRGEIRFKMLGYHTPKKFYTPKYELTNAAALDEITDQRKTIFWAPALQTDKEGRVHLAFYHSDISGKFEIVVEGVDQYGRFGQYRIDYSVD